MVDGFLKIGFYLVAGLVLIFSGTWFFRSLYETLTGTGEIVIAPFEIVGSGNVDAKEGSALAHMLQARLSEIERDIQAAQTELTPSNVRPAPAKPSNGGRLEQADRPRGPSTDIAVAAAPPAPDSAVYPTVTPRLFTEAATLKTALLEPTALRLSVGGVEVGGLWDWLERRLANRRTVIFTLYRKQHDAQISGSLAPMAVRDDALRMNISSEQSQDAVALDRIVDKVAYEVIRRRLSQEESNRVEALNTDEFQSLVEVMRSARDLKRRVALGRNALLEYQALLPQVTTLADQVPEWYQLNAFAATIAESAQDWETAVEYYERVRDVISKDSKLASLSTDVASKIATASNKRDEVPGNDLVKPVANPDPAAVKEISGFAATATAYLNELLKQQLKPPPVLIHAGKESRGFFSFWDGKRIVVPLQARSIPDIVYREASWPHLLVITGSDAWQKNTPFVTIIYAYVDIFTMLVHQHENHETERTSSWVLGPGAVEAMAGQDPAESKTRTPYVSLKEPGKAYRGDRQVAHMRQYVTRNDVEVRYINSGILTKAFYETAIRTSTDRAAEIWIAALRKLKDTVDFTQFAKILSNEAGGDQKSVGEALQVVGLNPAKQASTK